MKENSLRQSICDTSRWMWERGLSGAAEGNISCRFTSSQLLCTPAGGHKGMLKPQDIVLTDLEGSVIGEGTPSTEIQLHLEIYAQRQDCAAVVHAHPTSACAFAYANKTIPDNVIPEAAVMLGPVALVPFAMPGTSATREAIRPLLQDHKAFLLANHGPVVFGSNLLWAYLRMETLERVCAALLRADELGGAVPLPEEAASLLRRDHLNGKLK